MVQNNVGSLIKNVSSLQQDEINKTTGEPFEWWGPSPAEARKKAVEKKKGLRDKRTTLKDAVGKYVKDGINLGIAGFVNTRPYSKLKELRQMDGVQPILID